MTDPKMTEPQRRALAFLVQVDHASPRAVARHLWPDSAAWGKRTIGRGASGRPSGAVGGTMPMLAARILWRLDALGLAHQVPIHITHSRWESTDAGRALIASHGPEDASGPSNG